MLTPVTCPLQDEYSYRVCIRTPKRVGYLENNLHRSKFVAVIDYAAFTVFPDVSKGDFDFVSDLDFFGIAVGYLTGHSGTVIEFYYRHTVWRFVFESLGREVNCGIGYNFASTLELMGFQLSNSTAYRTHVAWREENFITVSTSRADEIVSICYLSPKSWNGNFSHPSLRCERHRSHQILRRYE